MAGITIDLKGHKALVTGGSRGIGRAIAVELAKAGCDVAINYLRNKGPAQETAAAVEAAGRRALLWKGNVADAESHADMFAALKAELGGLDILISNAASGVIKPALELTPRHWHWTMDINAGALLSLAQHAVTLMGPAGGHIVAVSSLGQSEDDASPVPETSTPAPPTTASDVPTTPVIAPTTAQLPASM